MSTIGKDAEGKIRKQIQEWLERIKKEVGFDFGVGYPHDERSIEFVKKCLREKTFLEYLRHSWTTVQELKGKKKQKKLGEF
jgi:ribonuclease HII